MKEAQKELPEDRLWQPVTARWFAAIFGVSLGYAVLRYHVFEGVPWGHFPLFILNKALSLSAVGFLACSYLVGKLFRWHDHDPHLRLVVIKFCGLMGFFLAAAHGFFSFLLLTPAYFAKYHTDDGKLNVKGELGMALGILGLFFLLSPAITTLPMMAKAIGGWRWKRNQRAGYISLTLVAGHLLVLGLSGWMAPSTWPAGLAPISLIAFVFAVTPLIVKRRLVHEKERKKDARQASS